jgi:hypothetical protein
MKPKIGRQRIEAFNAHCKAQLKAIWEALPPEERARREERQRQERLRYDTVALALAAQQIPHEINAALSHGGLPGSLGYEERVKIQQAWTAGMSKAQRIARAKKAAAASAKVRSAKAKKKLAKSVA